MSRVGQRGDEELGSAGPRAVGAGEGLPHLLLRVETLAVDLFSPADAVALEKTWKTLLG